MFQIEIATIYRWISRKKEKGNVEPLRRPYAYKLIDDQKLIYNPQYGFELIHQ